MFDVLWERLEKQISRLTTLNPGWQAGASEAEIQEAQQRLGIILPEDYARLVRRHNGQSDAFGVSILSAGGRLAPLEEIVRQHEEMLEWQSDEFFEELDDRRRIRGVIHHAQRVDIGGSIHFDGDNTVLDYIPGPEGVPGQVLAKISECEYTVIGHSFTDYLQRVV
ncbi:MAG: SMI1/KNR4 family protein, partial [Myxococcota bacterium]